MLSSRVLQKCMLLCVCVVMVTRGHEGHAHIPESERPSNFNDPKFTQDEEHLKEHLKDEINVKKNMSPQEMEFHYFRLHDTNNDTLLDGIEIMQAMVHMLPTPEMELQEKLGKSKEQIELIMEDRRKGMMRYYEDIIDRVLMDDDVDKDGYLTYSEFVRARRREEYHQIRMREEQMKHEKLQYEQFKEFQAMQGKGQGPPAPPPSQQGQQQHEYQQGVRR